MNNCGPVKKTFKYNNISNTSNKIEIIENDCKKNELPKDSANCIKCPTNI